MSSQEPSPLLLNTDWKKRDTLLGLKVVWGKTDSGGVVHFDRVELAVLDELLKLKFIDPNERQNESPSVAELVEFMRSFPGAYAFGYAVSPKRDDYRVSLEGIAVDKPAATTKAIKAAKVLCKNADEKSFTNGVYCWWD